MKAMSPLIKSNLGNQRRLRSDHTGLPARARADLGFISGDMVFIVRYLHNKTSRTSERIRNTSSKCPGTLGKFLEAFGGFENRLEVSVAPVTFLAWSSGERAKWNDMTLYFCSTVQRDRHIEWGVCSEK